MGSWPQGICESVERFVRHHLRWHTKTRLKPHVEQVTYCTDNFLWNTGDIVYTPIHVFFFLKKSYVYGLLDNWTLDDPKKFRNVTCAINCVNNRNKVNFLFCIVSKEAAAKLLHVTGVHDWIWSCFEPPCKLYKFRQNMDLVQYEYSTSDLHQDFSCFLDGWFYVVM